MLIETPSSLLISFKESRGLKAPLHFERHPLPWQTRIVASDAIALVTLPTHDIYEYITKQFILDVALMMLMLLRRKCDLNLCSAEFILSFSQWK